MIEINLLPEELKSRLGTKIKKTPLPLNFEKKNFLYLIPLVVTLLICAHIYLAVLAIAKNNELRALNNKWQKLEPQRKLWEDFNKEYAIVSSDAQQIKYLTERKVNWAQKLNKLSLLLPPGIWFNELSVSPSGFTLQGSVVSLRNEEMNLIKALIDNLKGDAGFFKDFGSLELSSVQKKTIGGYDVTHFVLIGTLKPR